MNDGIRTSNERLRAALEAILPYIPEKEWIGGVETGYYQPTGEALLKVRQQIVDALVETGVAALRCLECNDTGLLVRGKHPTVIGEPCYTACLERALRTLTPGIKPLVSSNENHERWLAETWQMIEECAKQTDQRHRISLSPMGCTALLKERSSHETCEQRAPVERALGRRVYLKSERDMSGYRVVIGFDTLTDVQAAHQEVADIPKAPTQKAGE